MRDKPLLILVAHGSRDPAWRGSLFTLGKIVQAKLEGHGVRVAFMQFDGPSLPEVVEEAVQSGHRTLRLLPLFMASAGHVDQDIKPLVAGLARAHPTVDLQLMTPVGEDELFPGLVVDIATGPRGALDPRAEPSS